MNDALGVLDAIPRLGRVALIDFVRSPSHEARLAFPSLMKSVLSRSGARLAWAGSIDQLLIGDADTRFDDVLISEFPTGEACLHALSERREWEPESFVSEMESYAGVPWSRPAAALCRVVFGSLGLLGGGPKPALLAGAELARTAPEGRGEAELAPDSERLHELAASDIAGRVVMLNLLAYRERARYDELQVQRSGEGAYSRYARRAAALIGRLGGRLRWAGRKIRLLDAGAEEAWDSVALVQYPSRAAFLGMLGSPEYQRAGRHREAGLARTRLFVCTSHAEFF